MHRRSQCGWRKSEIGSGNRASKKKSKIQRLGGHTYNIKKETVWHCGVNCVKQIQGFIVPGGRHKNCWRERNREGMCPRHMDIPFCNGGLLGTCWLRGSLSFVTWADWRGARFSLPVWFPVLRWHELNEQFWYSLACSRYTQASEKEKTKGSPAQAVKISKPILCGTRCHKNPPSKGSRWLTCEKTVDMQED
jgi:hypothetical protein